MMQVLGRFWWLVSRELLCWPAGWQFRRDAECHSSMALFVRTLKHEALRHVEPRLRKQQQLRQKKIRL